MNHLLMIIGGKGVGKTTIAKYLAGKYGFVYVDNESVYIRHQKQHPEEFVFRRKEIVDLIYQEVENGIRQNITSSSVVHEATGASPQWRELYERLSDLEPRVIKIACSFEIALKRYRKQDLTGKHVAPDIEEHAREVYQALLNLGINPDFTIDNSGSIQNTELNVDSLMRELDTNEI